MIVVLATQNMGKVREIDAMLGDAGIEWKTLDAFSPVPEPEETGATFLENATLTARYYARHTGELTLAEDSGLEVDALQGRPGVYSARYA
ncbi:MAG: non-canonical purine NTP pyrophosphatase, partial [Planctomycetota bacterium]